MADKKTIGLSTNNEQILQQIMDKGYFSQEMEAAKFALSYAIKNNTSQSSSETFNTKWNVGSFDTDNKLRNLISVLEPENNEPYRRIEALANNGIRLIGEHIEKNNDLFLDELLKI